MALNGDRLGLAIAAVVAAEYIQPISGADLTKLQTHWKNVANQIVAEITGNAVVNPGTLAITPADIDDSSSRPCSGNGAVNQGTGTVS